MIKNDPYKLLEKEGVAKKVLSERSLEALSIYDETLEGLKEFPDDKTMKDMAEQIGDTAIELLKEDIATIKDELSDKAEQQQKKQLKKAQSKKIVEKSEKTMDYLAECRRKLRDERKQKMASGEIKKPVKRKLTTKLKDNMKKIANMMPKAIKEDPNKVEQTEKAVQKFLGDLKRIWGMNKIKPIEDELHEKFSELKEKAEQTA